MDNSKNEENLQPNPLLPLGEGAQRADEGIKNRKKILLVTRPIAPPWDEASKNFAYNLAINSPDFEFTLLTNGIIPDLPPRIKQDPIYTSNKFTFFQKLKLLKRLKKLKLDHVASTCICKLTLHIEKIKKPPNDFDIIHFIFTPTKQNSFLVKKFIKNKKAKTIQTIATLREDLYSDNEIKKLMFADKIITYSKYAKNKLNGLGLNNIEQVYPGIDLDKFKPEPKDKKLIENLKLKIENFIVTYPGEFTRLGATDSILDMICQDTSILVSNNIKIVFACRVKNKKDKAKKEEIIKKLKNKKIDDLVIFTDTVSDMASLYNLSDVIIFPVRDMKGKFDVPLAVIEAMACGKPVIISDLPILREFSNEENSVIIQSGIQPLKDAILELHQNKEKRESIGMNAQKFAEENFDIRKISNLYKDLYKKLLE